MDFDIEFQNVSFQYDGSETFALSNINLNVKSGEIVLITGPAGSGKTTLCSCILGLVPHFHEGELTGAVLVKGNNTVRSRIGGLATLVGMVFQDPESQLVTASVADEVAFGPENLGIPRDEITRRVDEALSATRLDGYNDREPYSLSGGEQQACVIAAIYAMHPEIYVMDEPLANLDPAGRAQVLQLVIDVAKKRGKTLVLVEHAIEEVLPLVDRVIVLNNGKIVRDGSVSDVLALGDIPQVFSRPPIARLAESFGLNPLPLTPEAFYDAFTLGHTLSRLAPMVDEPVTQPSEQTTLIEIRNVSFSYDREAAALRNVSVTFYNGELVAIMGRNGSGKTTLVRHIIGLLQPDQGQVTVLGKDVAITPTHELAQDVGFCFQNPNHQIVSFNVRDEMTFGLKAHGIDPAEYDERIHRALAFVDMEGFLDTEIFDLGKGQKQRIALASVLTLNPSILIIDEPTTGQDPRMAEEIFEIIKSLNDRGTTVLMITHKVDYAARFASRALVMQRGSIAYDGPMRDLLTDVELMKANSLELPNITRLANRLQPNGVPPWLVTVDEMAAALQQLSGGSHDN